MDRRVDAGRGLVLGIVLIQAAWLRAPQKNKSIFKETSGKRTWVQR
jgi:hypothetical protein